MTRSQWVRAAALGMLCFGPVAPKALADEPRLLRPGQYHGKEVTGISGERWLALVHDAAGRDRLAPVTLRVDTVRDELVDADGPPTGKRVSAAPGGEIVVLLAGIPELRPRSVTTLAIDREITPSEPARLALRGGVYQLTLECGIPAHGVGSEQVACSLVVRRANWAQVLRTYDAQFVDGAFVAVGDDAQPKLLWAGDLNGDGALDLLLDLSDHYNVSRPTLFLSRRHGALLESVAMHQSVGC